MIENDTMDYLQYRKSTEAERELIIQAQVFSIYSDDPSTQCSALIVDSDLNILAGSYNSFPNNVAITKERLERPKKYEFMEHAERNAIYAAAKQGISTLNTTMYLNYFPSCCSDCVRAIVQSGIKTVVGPNIPFPGIGKGLHYDKHAGNICIMKEGMPDGANYLNVVVLEDITE